MERPPSCSSPRSEPGTNESRPTCETGAAAILEDAKEGRAVDVAAFLTGCEGKGAPMARLTGLALPAVESAA
eukprot:4363771-Amphidinium_carterae.1